MADNVTLPGTGIDVRTIDKGGDQAQVVVLDLGGAGAESLLTGSMPVTGEVALNAATLAALETVSVANFPATQPVSAAALPLPTGASTEVTLAAVKTILDDVKDTVNSAITAAHPVLDTRSMLFAVNPGGTYGNIERTNGGNLKVAVEEFDSALPAGTNNIGIVDLSAASLAALETVNVTDGGGSLTVDAPVGTPVFVRLSDGTAAYTAASPLPVTDVASGVASTVNSTTANLAAAGVFTGTSEDVGSFSTIMVSVFASHASATNGLSLQQSSDGVNWDITDVYTIPAATGKVFSLGVQARYFRLVYTNGATLTTSLRIQTLVSKYAKKFSSQRPEDGRGNDNDFEEQLSYLMGYDGTSAWNRLRSTTANGLAVDVTRIADMRSATLHVTATAAVNTASTCTLPAAGAGLFHYITSVELVKLYAVVGVAAGAGVIVTTTNVPGSLAWTTEQLASPAGSAPKVIQYNPTTPLKSSVANTATTFVAPVQLQTIWRWNVSYFTAA